MLTELVDERAFLGAETSWSTLLASCQLGFGSGEYGELLLPVALQTPSHQTIFRVDREIASFSARGFVAGALDVQAPLGKSRVMVGFELLGSGDRRTQFGWRAGGEERLGDGRIDLLAADGQAVTTTTIGQLAGGAVIAGGA